MSIQSIDHIQLAMPVGAEDAARKFYSGLLGIPEVAKPPALAIRGGVWFEHGPVRVHLGGEADFRPARKAHPAFLVRGLEQLIERCRSAGVDVSPADSLRGEERCYVADPFGNRIELIGQVDGAGQS